MKQAKDTAIASLVVCFRPSIVHTVAARAVISFPVKQFMQELQAVIFR